MEKEIILEEQEMTEYEVKRLLILERIDELDRVKDMTDDPDLIEKIEERKKALRSQLPVT